MPPLPGLLLATLLQATVVYDPDLERPSPVPASDSAADVAAKVAELKAFFGGDEALLREAVATAQQSDLIERLRARHGARLAGVWVDNDPGWHIIVRLTGTTPQADEQYPGPLGPQHVHYHTGAPLTEAEMRRRLATQRSGLIELFPDMFGFGLDVRTGEMNLTLKDTPAHRATAAAAIEHLQLKLGFPVRIQWLSPDSRQFPP